jgi:DeoR/GlpR family transcriptional regulator of sugar metabolism
MLVNERQQQILEYLFTQQVATVAELSERFDVSTVTIRNDLTILEELGRVARTRGGARIVDGRIRQELTFATRQQLRAEAKQAIGELAATLVESHTPILLDSSTTAVAVGAAIKRNPELTDLTIVTTGIWTALELLGSPNINVVLAGGYVRNITGSIAGSITNQVLRNFNFRQVFLGGWGLTLHEGLTDTHLMEVELKQFIIERAREVIVVMDGAKFGRTALASFATVEQIHRVVTDEAAPPDMLAALRDRGVEVLVASADRTRLTGAE